MRYEKAETVLRLALDMQGSVEGLSLEDIRTRYSDQPLSRRTAERLRDAVERIFPQMEQANPGEVPKRWRLPLGAMRSLAEVTPDELADLATAAAILKRENMPAQARRMEGVASKLKSALKRSQQLRLEPDVEALAEAEGFAMRPGPRPVVAPEVIAGLRQAILGTRKVRLFYRYRGSGKRGFETVHPYGFLYGWRHYLVAWSENPRSRDFRNYSFSNIEHIELLRTSFVRRDGFSLQEYASRSFGVFQEQPFEVVWRFDAHVATQAREFYFHPTQTLQPQADGTLLVRFKAGGALEMAWHLYTWGNHVAVLEPADFWQRADKARI